jgi:hypothetical protein
VLASNEELDTKEGRGSIERCDHCAHMSGLLRRGDAFSCNEGFGVAVSYFLHVLRALLHHSPLYSCCLPWTSCSLSDSPIDACLAQQNCEFVAPYLKTRTSKDSLPVLLFLSPTKTIPKYGELCVFYGVSYCRSGYFTGCRCVFCMPTEHNHDKNGNHHKLRPCVECELQQDLTAAGMNPYGAQKMEDL